MMSPSHWFTIAVHAMLLVGLAHAGYPVRVLMPDEVPLDGCQLTVYGWSGDKTWPREISGEAVAGRKDVQLSLAMGEYGVEVSGVSKTGVIVLRARQFCVSGPTTVRIKAIQVPVTARIAATDVPPEHDAVRHLGTGQQSWNALQFLPDMPDGPPALTLSPGETYTVSCVARRKPTTLVLWKRLVPRAGQPLAFTDAEARYEVTFEPAPGTPQLRHSAAFFDFPDRQITLDDPLAGGRLLTNRDRAMLGYEVTTTAGQRLRWSSQGQRFASKSRLRIAGRLTNSVFAGPLGSAPDWTHWTDYLIKRAYLIDVTGRHVVLNKSDFGFVCHLIYNGKRIVHDAPDDTALAAGGVQSASVPATLTYAYGGPPATVTVACEPWTTVATAHFKIDTPPALRLRAAAYLEMMERLHQILRDSTRRPGPDSCSIKLRGDEQMAQTGLGAGGVDNNAWMAMPLKGLEEFDCFTEPALSNNDPYFGHELLHAFRYDHGDEMFRLDRDAENVIRQFRWRAADTGIWPVWSDPASIDRR